MTERHRAVRWLTMPRSSRGPLALSLSLLALASPVLGAQPGAARSSSSLAKSTREPDPSPALPPMPLSGWTPKLPSAEGAPAGASPTAPAEDTPSGATDAAPPPPPPSAELGISVGVPYFDDEILRPDVTVELRYARRLFDFVVPTLAGGYRIARLDPQVVPDEVYANQIESPFVSLGARIEAPVSSWMRPFIGGAADLAWWSTTFDTHDYCQDPSATWYPSAWGCYDKDDWGFAPVYRAQLGFLIKPEPSMALEFVAEAAVIPAADTFTRRVTLLTPSLGFAWHH